MVVFLYVILNIIKINKILSDYFEDDVISMFLDGYCLEYFEILKRLYPEAKMVLQKDKDHCATLIDGNIYDVSGIRNIDDFILASKFDYDYVYSFYKRFSLLDKENIDKLIDENSKCLVKKDLHNLV